LEEFLARYNHLEIGIVRELSWGRHLNIRIFFALHLKIFSRDQTAFASLDENQKLTRRYFEK